MVVLTFLISLFPSRGISLADLTTINMVNNNDHSTKELWIILKKEENKTFNFSKCQ
jgi:hypothetical protein